MEVFWCYWYYFEGLNGRLSVGLRVGGSLVLVSRVAPTQKQKKLCIELHVGLPTGITHWIFTPHQEKNAFCDHLFLTEVASRGVRSSLPGVILSEKPLRNIARKHVMIQFPNKLEIEWHKLMKYFYVRKTSENSP